LTPEASGTAPGPSSKGWVESARNFDCASRRYPKYPTGRAWVRASPLSPVGTNRRKSASSSIWERGDGRKSCFTWESAKGNRSAFSKTLQAVAISTVTGRRLCCAQARRRNAPNRSQVAGAVGVSRQQVAVALETTIAKIRCSRKGTREQRPERVSCSGRMRKRSVDHGS